MKGLKYVLPVVGVFLVFYIASVVVSTIKINGVISQLNNEYKDEFTLVYSEMGNVFFDTAYDFSVRSNQSGIIYSFRNEAGKLSGTYENETNNHLVKDELESKVRKDFVILVHSKNLSFKAENELQNATFESMTVRIIGTNVEDGLTEVSKQISESFNEPVNLVFFEGSEDMIKRMKEEQLTIVQQSNLDEEVLEKYSILNVNK